MNSRTLSEVALKVWGVVCLATAVSWAVKLLITWGATSSSANDAATARMFSVAIVGNVVLSAITGLLLLALAKPIALRLFPNTEEIAGAFPPEELLAAALAVLGAYFIVTALQHGAVVGYELVTKPKWDEMGSAEFLWNKQREALIRFAVEFAGGFVLMFWRVSLVKVWSRIHSFERPRPSDTLEDDSSEDERAD